MLISLALLTLQASDGAQESTAPQMSQQSTRLFSRAETFWNGLCPVMQTTAIVGWGVAGIVGRNAPYLLNAATIGINPPAAIATMALQHIAGRVVIGAAINGGVVAYRFAPQIRGAFGAAQNSFTAFRQGVSMMSRALSRTYATA